MRRTGSLTFGLSRPLGTSELTIKCSDQRRTQGGNGRGFTDRKNIAHVGPFLLARLRLAGELIIECRRRMHRVKYVEGSYDEDYIQTLGERPPRSRPRTQNASASDNVFHRR